MIANRSEGSRRESRRQRRGRRYTGHDHLLKPGIAALPGSCVLRSGGDALDGSSSSCMNRSTRPTRPMHRNASVQRTSIVPWNHPRCRYRTSSRRTRTRSQPYHHPWVHESSSGFLRAGRRAPQAEELCGVRRLEAVRVGPHPRRTPWPATAPRRRHGFGSLRPRCHTRRTARSGRCTRICRSPRPLRFPTVPPTRVDAQCGASASARPPRAIRDHVRYAPLRSGGVPEREAHRWARGQHAARGSWL